jgi:hypothetical protein
MTNETKGGEPADELIQIVQIARDIEGMKRDCGMDPESPTAIYNSKLMNIGYRLRALHAALQSKACASVGVEQALCPHCDGTGDSVAMSDGGPDAYDVTINCPHCKGSGALDDAYSGVCDLLKQSENNYREATAILYIGGADPSASKRLSALAEYVMQPSMQAEWLRDRLLGLANIAALASPAPSVGEPVTPALINSLPQPLRDYIHELEARADPAGTVRELVQLRDTNAALQKTHRRLTDACDTPGNRNPEARYAGYKNEPLPSNATDDQRAAWNEGQRAQVVDFQRDIKLAATPPAATAVTEGASKLVPFKATKAMQDAWDSAPSSEDSDADFAGAYAAMLDAAPAAAVPESPAATEPPSGFQTVPVEPSEEMMNAGLYQSSKDSEWADVYSMWKDMLAVAAQTTDATQAPAATEPSDAQNPKFTMSEWAAHARKYRWRFDLDEAPSDGTATAAPAVGASPEPAAWMNGASLTIFASDRERYPMGGGGDMATARYMRSDHHDTPLYRGAPAVGASVQPVQASPVLKVAIDALEILDRRPRPMCRDCADEDGTCPSSGLPCDMRATIRDARAALASSTPTKGGAHEQDSV